MTLPVDTAALAIEALDSFPASLLDDPTAWPQGGAVMVVEVETEAARVVRENYRSLLARRIGPHVQDAATDMETAIAEDGPLADLEAVWAAYVTGLELEDTSALFAAKDWDARVAALSELVGLRIAGAPAPAVPAERLNAYVAADPRLADLAVSQKHECAPAFAAPSTAASFSWEDDEMEEEAPAPAAPARPDPIQISDTRPTPLLFQMLEPIGVLNTDVAEITGINKATISNAKNGKRPWQGLTEKQATDLADELDARVEAARELARRLRLLDPAVVDGNTRQ